MSLSYDPAAQPTDPSGYVCQQSPLPAGSVVCRRIESGTTRDAGGNLLSERHATFFSYDARARLIRTVGPINLDNPAASDVVPIEEVAYWGDGESLARRGRIRQVSRYPLPSASPHVTGYDYDLFGPFQVTQPNGALTTIVKDGRGRPTAILSAASGARLTRYYDGREPRVEIRPTGSARRFGHDSMGRLASVEYLSGDPEAPGAVPALGWAEYHSYDAAGNRIRSERRSNSGAVTWRQERQFDVQHRLVSETNPASPSNFRANTFDASGYLTQASDEQGRATLFTRDRSGHLTVSREGSDATGSPVSLTLSDRYISVIDGSYRVRYDQLVDANGQLTSYEKDYFSRLSSVASSNFKGGNVSLVYDARGNLLRKYDLRVDVAYTYDGLDRPLSLSASNSADGSSIVYAFHYDEAGAIGRLTSIVEPDRKIILAYDVMGRLVRETVEEIGVTAPLVTQYSYDAAGATSAIVYPSGLRIVYERDPATGEVVRAYNPSSGAS